MQTTTEITSISWDCLELEDAEPDLPLVASTMTDDFELGGCLGLDSRREELTLGGVVLDLKIGRPRSHPAGAHAG